jgi:hypothetical protein
MRSLLDLLFPRRRNLGDSKKLIQTMKKMSILSEEIMKKKGELDDIRFSMLVEKKEEMFISLADFLDLIGTENINIDSVIKKCKHLSELDPESSSVAEVFSIVENDHIILCPDTKNCEAHKNCKGDSIKIVMVKK